MSTTGRAMAVLVAAITMCTAANAGTTATKKQVAITITPGAVTTFALSLTSEGSVVRDSGNVTFQQETERILTRGGQRVRQWTGIGTFAGTRGQLSLRFRIDWLNAGRGHEAGSGTWSVTGGTEAYASVSGGGRSAHVWLPKGPVASRADGYLQG